MKSLFLLLISVPSFAASVNTCPKFLQRDVLCEQAKKLTHCEYGMFDFDCEDVSDRNIRLLGSGLVHRETQDSIALACSDAECRKLRFAYYEIASNKKYFFGPVYTVPQTLRPVSEEVSSVILEEVTQIILSIRLQRSSMNAQHRFIWADIVDTKIARTPTRNRRAKLTDRNGWNWSSQPREVSSGAFQGSVYNYSGYFDTVWRDNRAYRSAKRICDQREAVGGYERSSTIWLNLILSNRGNTQMYYPAMAHNPDLLYRYLDKKYGGIADLLKLKPDAIPCVR